MHRWRCEGSSPRPHRSSARFLNVSCRAGYNRNAISPSLLARPLEALNLILLHPVGRRKAALKIAPGRSLRVLSQPRRANHFALSEAATAYVKPRAEKYSASVFRKTMV